MSPREPSTQEPCAYATDGDKYKIQLPIRRCLLIKIVDVGHRGKQHHVFVRVDFNEEIEQNQADDNHCT